LSVKDSGMNPSRLVLAIVAGCCLLRPSPLAAQDAAPPFVMEKQYSADMVISTGKGQDLTQKIYNDDGKLRTEITTHGMQIVGIIRPDLKKIYSVMVAQKMVMEVPYDAEKYKKQLAAASGPEGKFEVIGPDAVDGVACTKYKVTGQDNKVLFFWVNTATKTPVKMMAEDGSFTLFWKNYKPGPQDPSLFEPPADYQVITMPGGAGQ
jgi:Domain of unknown function (DUF4412)